MPEFSFSSNLGETNANETGFMSDDAAESEITGADRPSRQWIGRTFGDYQIVGRLGQGGMGLVFLAFQKSTQRQVALKVIRDDRLDDFDSNQRQHLITRFMSEARAVAHLEHDNIVTVYEIGQVESHHFFSMQLVHGMSLSKLARRKSLSDKEVAELMVPVCRALQHAHSRGILHRDIKPSNIMVDDGHRPFLTDFGLAKWFEDNDATMTRSGQVVGTVAYMAPEQALDSAHATISCDVYSLGATMYQLLTGRPPFSQGSFVDVLQKVMFDKPSRPSKLAENVNLDLETIALKCLEKTPSSRYRTADELGDDLQRFLDGQPILARPVGQGERFWRWCKRNPWIAGLGASVVLLLITTLVASLIGYVSVSLSNERTRMQLRESLLLQAQALRSSTEAGRRGLALEALRQAAEIETGMDLRDEYVRYLDQPDIELLHDIAIPGWDQGSTGYADAVDSGRIIAVSDKGLPMEINPLTGEITKRFDQIGMLQRDLERGSSFLAQVSRDGKYLAGNSQGAGEVEIWDLNETSKLGSLKNAAGEIIQVDCLVFDDLATSVFCAGKQDGSSDVVHFYRYSVPELKLLSTWQKTDAFVVVVVSIMEPGVLFAKIGNEGKSRLVTWQHEVMDETPRELNDQEVDIQWPAKYAPRSMAIESDLHRLYLGESSGSIRVFGLPTTRSMLQPFVARHAKTILAVDVSLNGRWLVTAAEDRQLRIWDRLGGDVVTQVEIDSGRASNTQWLPDGETLLSDTEQGLRIWKFVPPLSRQFLIRDKSGTPQTAFRPIDIEFCPTEAALFYSGGGFFSRLDLSNDTTGFELLQDNSRSGEIFVSQDGQQCATIHDDTVNPLQLMSLRSPDFASVGPSSDSQFISLEQLADGRLVYNGLVDDRHLVVSQLNPEKELLNLDIGERSDGPLKPQIAVAADGNRIAIQTPSTDSDNSLKVFDIDSGQLIFERIIGYWIAFDIDAAGQRVVCRNGDELTVWDSDTGTDLFSIQLQKPTNRFALSGDGRFLAIMDETEGRIQLFNSQFDHSQFERELTLFSKQVLPVWIALSRTGKWMAICDRNGAVRLWNLERVRNELKREGIVK